MSENFGNDTMEKETDLTAPAEISVTDRRPRFDAGDGTVAEAPGKRYPTVLAELEGRARATEARLAEALDLLRRREAEADQFRARLRKEMERRSRSEVEGFLRSLLEVVDSLDRGVAATAAEKDAAGLREGLGKVRDQFVSILARHDVKPMELLGKPFDPSLAEAVALSPLREGEREGEIVSELRRGYSWGAQVLRPAQVRVARLTATPTPDPAGEAAPTEA